MILRSITIHLSSWEELERSRKILEELKSLAEARGLPVWSLRISMPPVEWRELPGALKRLKIASKILEGLLISAFNLEGPDEKGSEHLVEALGSLGSVYASILVRGEEDLGPLSRQLGRIYKSLDPKAHTRIAAAYGSWILTPYFPISPSTVESTCFSAALRYAPDFEASITGRGFESLSKNLDDVDEKLEEISEEAGVAYAGMDLSLSPWMEESVARIVEKLSGTKIPGPGTIAAVSAINKEISRLCGMVRSTGYCEAMLPVEEDSVLKERASEGALEAKHLIPLTAFCVAGLDMATLPLRDLLSGALDGIVEDLWAIHKLKGRPLGMRLIAPDARPGEKVDLDRFGIATVMKI